jgi:hypothetical protein
MSVRLGKDAKLYFCTAGIGGAPDWAELVNVKNVSTNLQKGEADVTTRGNNGWKASVGTLKEGSIEFEMIWDEEDAGFTAVEEAYFNDTPLGIAVMTGPIDQAGSKGLWADCAVLDFSRDESLEEAITVKVTVKPTYSVNAPQWVTVGGEGGAASAEATTTTVNVTSEGQTALAANPNRHSAVLVNDSDTDIYIKLGTEPAVGTGIKLNAYGGSFAITAANMYRGLITAICASAEAKSLLVTEY